MSIIRADSIKNRAGTGAPDFPNGITVTGVVTATTTSQNITGDLTVSGSLGVGGTVTYEDVKNVDSIGIITARSGIQIGAGGTIGSSGGGIVTYFGDGSQLTGIDATQIATGNTKVQTVASRIDNKIDNVGVLTVTSAGANVSGILTTSYHKVNDFDLINAVSMRSLHNVSSSSNMHNATEDIKFSTGTHPGANTNVYNSTNGRYTAPVRGLYLFMLRGLLDDSHSGGAAELKIYINGSNSSIIVYYESANSKYQAVGSSAILNLNANDYFTLYGNSKLHISQETQFSCCLSVSYTHLTLPTSDLV